MTFGAALALLIGMLVALPLAAHLLRRGGSELVEFPPTKYATAIPATARQRSALQHHTLLLLRILGIVGLALLGATPFVRCSGLRLARSEGASVAMVFVVDDSLSMRARLPNGDTRFKLAVDSAKELLSQARSGDTVGIILAGTSARLILPPTPDIRSAVSVMDGIQPSDRGTDLPRAVVLARSILAVQPHADKRLLVLSDLASEVLPVGTPPITAPVQELRKPLADCAVISASTHSSSVTVDISCSAGAVAAKRKIRLVVLDTPGAKGTKDSSAARPGTELASHPLARTAGLQRIELPVVLHQDAIVEAILDGADDIAEDDRARLVAREEHRMIGVVADLESARGATGGPSVLEQALLALTGGDRTRPIAALPEDVRELAPFSALLLEDPEGFAPEARVALAQWLNGGGVILALLGPSSVRPRLGWSLEPLVVGAVRWEEAPGLALRAESIAWLGDESQTLSKLAALGRIRLPASARENGRSRGDWNDGEPWLVEQEFGRGLAWVIGLPATPSQSDFALRPGFLAVVDQIVQQAAHRSGTGHQWVGSPWTFPVGETVRVLGPGGPVPIHTQDGRQAADPPLAGRYEIQRREQSEYRTARIDAEELTLRPQQLPPSAGAATRNAQTDSLDISRYVAFGLLVLFAIELLLRAVHATRRRGPFVRTVRG